MKISSFRRLLAASSALVAVTGVALGEVYVLSHGDLRVEIEVATSRHLAEFGPRFDRTAIVRSITLAGQEFLGTWGLCDEFGLYGNGVLGYETAAVGGQFVKIGVGILVRDTTEGYHFARSYPVHGLFPVRIEAGDRQLTIRQDSDPAFPQRYHYRKTYTLDEDNVLTITYHLENTGDGAWTFEHYNHHWFSLQDVAVGPRYRATTGFALPEAETRFQVKRNLLQMATPLRLGDTAYYASDLSGATSSTNSFELSVGGTTVLRYDGSFPPARFALYASEAGFCPEVFKRSNLQPGETVDWSAAYRFMERGPAGSPGH